MAPEIVFIVCLTAVCLMFMQEMTGIFKKVVAIPGVVLFVPLLLASWIIEAYADIWEWLAWAGQYEIQTLLAHLVPVLPFHLVALQSIKIILLCLCAFIPTFVLWGVARYKGRYTVPRIASYISVVTWILALFLLI